MHGKYIEGLNSFNKEEDLRPVSEDSLYKLFRKSLAMDLEKRFKILEKSLSRGDFEFELANVYSSDKNIKKPKGNQTQQCLMMRVVRRKKTQIN